VYNSHSPSFSYSNSSHSYNRNDTDKLCQTAITAGNWDIKHFDTLNYSTISVPKAGQERVIHE
jgi:hypothetical protein